MGWEEMRDGCEGGKRETARKDIGFWGALFIRCVLHF